jgi:PKHD-type hydroxylase
MFLHIPQVLTAAEIETLITQLQSSAFIDGKLSAGASARLVKQNLQLDRHSENYQPLAQLVHNAMLRHQLVRSFAFPKQIFAILFNKYEAGMSYGDHFDTAIMPGVDGEPPHRSDLSFTLFLSDPATYSGGELAINTFAGTARFKLSVGDAILYPASTIHRVETVTQGTRLAAVGWIQSLIKDPTQREILHDMSKAINKLGTNLTGTPEVLLLSKSYANLLRLWAEV